MSCLFQNGKIGNLEIPNRIVRSATAERMADETGRPISALRNIWVNLARGGTGLIISGHMYVHPSGKCHPEMTGIYDDLLVSSLAELVEAVQMEGGKIAAQINHGGMQCSSDVVNETMAPSDIERIFLEQPARMIEVEEIYEIIDSYAQAGRRAKQAGFDAVQLHGAHGYLINQFLSPYVNKREDDWGGDFSRRCKFLKEVVRAVRSQVGTDYPLFIKFGMEDGLDEGLSVDEGANVIAQMEEMGLDAVEISGGIQAQNTKKGIKNIEKEAYFQTNAKIARSVTNLPIILVGGMRSKEKMEEVLNCGDADFISMCRPLINDPNFPELMRTGKKMVSDCISSNNCWPQKMGEGIACKCPKID